MYIFTSIAVLSGSVVTRICADDKKNNHALDVKYNCTSIAKSINLKQSLQCTDTTLPHGVLSLVDYLIVCITTRS